jgi:PAS domain S-box-containing protein
MPNDAIKILLVESEHDDYLLIQNLVSRTRGTKIELQWVQSLEEAGHLMSGEDFDAFLLDDRISETGGLDLVRQTLLIHDEVPLIILAEHDEYQPDVDAMRAGVTDYLVKGQLSAEVLERTVRYAIERKRIEAALHEAVSQQTPLATAIESVSVAVLITDPRQTDNPLIFVNPAFTAITGYTSDEVVGRNPRFLQHPDSDPEIMQAIRDALTGQRLFKGVMLNRRKDGTLYRNSLIISPVFDEHGELIYFVGQGEDITLQHQAQEALQQSEKRFARMIANVPGLIYRAQRHGDTVEFHFVSEGCRALLGIEPEQLQADPLLLRSMVHPEDRESYHQGVMAVMGEPVPKEWRWQGRVALPSGEEKIIEGSGYPDVQENGDIFWDGLVTDVTERVQAAQKAAQLAAIVTGSNDAIYAKTLDGIITSWNSSAEIMFGYTESELVGQSVVCLTPPDRAGEVDELLDRIARGKPVKNYETVRVAKDGSLLDVALTLSPMKDSEGHVAGVSTISHDIRERKQAEAEVERHMLQIQALRNIDMAITGSLDLRVTLNIVLDQVTTQLNVDSAAVLLLNSHTQRLEFAAGRGFRTNALQRTQLRIGEGYAGRAALERRLVSVSSLAHDAGDFTRAPAFATERFICCWAVPLVAKGHIAGVLEIFHRASLHPDSDWLNFLETLAGQAAIAIENADLFNDVQRSNVELQVAYDSTLEGWSKALDLRDKETEGHTLRVTENTMTLARAMHISDRDLIHIRRGALLHDIGKMGIPDSILLKPGKLTDEEWIVMKKHPVYAYELLAPIDFLRPALDIPYCHHEKWDGSGYPRGLKGEQIPLSARIFAVIDVWDALTSDRPYRAAWTEAKVRDHIAQGSGSHFDPRVVETFMDTKM